MGGSFAGGPNPHPPNDAKCQYDEANGAQTHPTSLIGLPPRHPQYYPL